MHQVHRCGSLALMAALLATGVALAETSASDPANSTHAGIGYLSVAAARAALSALPQAKLRVEDGWTIITDDAVGPQTTWTFASPAHPAYPVLIRRDAVMKQGAPTLVTRYLCEGRRAACESLYTTLKNSN